MATITMRIWDDSKNKWTEPEVVTEATAMHVLRSTKLFPEEELARIKQGKVVNCDKVTFLGVLDALTCDCITHAMRRMERRSHEV